MCTEKQLSILLLYIIIDLLYIIIDCNLCTTFNCQTFIGNSYPFTTHVTHTLEKFSIVCKDRSRGRPFNEAQWLRTSAKYRANRFDIAVCVTGNDVSTIDTRCCDTMRQPADARLRRKTRFCRGFFDDGAGWRRKTLIFPRS